MKSRIYLDNNATTPLLPTVKIVIKKSLEEFGNPSAIYEEGRQSRMEIDKTRRCLAEMCNVRSEQVIFTSGGSEANALAINGVMNNHDESYTGKSRLLISQIEHSSVYNQADLLANQKCKHNDKKILTKISVISDGIVNLEELEAELAKGEVRLISIMYANNETGVIQPVEKIAELCKKYGALFHCDAVQAIGKIAIDFTSSGFDMMSISAHKFGGLKGVGALVVRSEVKMDALICGGGQERNRRGGTENVLGIISMGAALEIAKKENYVVSHSLAKEKSYELRNFLEQEIKKLLTETIIVGEKSTRLENTSCLILPDEIDVETLVMRLDMAGISISRGSACSSGRVEPSRTLLAMGYSEKQATNAIRISLGVQNTRQEIETFVKEFAKLIG